MEMAYLTLPWSSLRVWLFCSQTVGSMAELTRRNVSHEHRLSHAVNQLKTKRPMAFVAGGQTHQPRMSPSEPILISHQQTVMSSHISPHLTEMHQRDFPVRVRGHGPPIPSDVLPSFLCEPHSVCVLHVSARMTHFNK